MGAAKKTEIMGGADGEKSLAWPAGFACGAAACGIKPSGKLDVGVLVVDRPVPAAATFTRNLVQAAPIVVSKEHLRAGGGFVRAVVVNAGNANACTGRRGQRDAEAMCAQVARFLKCPTEQVLVASTGIIGEPLDMPKIRRGIRAALERLSDSPAAFGRFARAICTTDRWPKTASDRLALDGGAVRVVGVVKGAGMIRPNMATMLGFIATDAQVGPRALRRALRDAVEASFNRITVDGHTSTNDFVVVLASGESDVAIRGKDDQEAFASSLSTVCLNLASQIVRDGEGATKRVEIIVRGCRDDDAAESVARAVAASPLVRTAMFGNDPGWGRIVSAVGCSGAVRDVADLRCKINDVLVYRDGTPAKFDAARLSRSMAAEKVTIEVELGEGEGAAYLQTCDLTYDYITINAEYRT